jgi:cell division protein FtsL
MRPFGFFEHRVRGFRVVELGGLGVLLVLILTVYLAKTGAGGKRADIDRIQQQIFQEQTQVRMLRAEVATLEQPERLEALSARYLGLQPISARREVTPQGLQDVARVAVVDHKTTLVTSDPLTQPGSPDLATAQAPVPADPAAAATTAPAGADTAAKPAAAKPATVAAAPQPIKLAQAGPAPHSPASHAAARPAATRKPAGGSAIDDILQGAR